MALARPASTVITKKPAARPAPFSPADFVVKEAASQPAPTSHIRRCTFRRVLPLATHRQLQMYSVDCTHPTYDTARPLGHLQAAREACAGCTLPGTFRPDED
jgi:hypothetical protein